MRESLNRSRRRRSCVYGWFFVRISARINLCIDNFPETVQAADNKICPFCMACAHEKKVGGIDQFYNGKVVASRNRVNGGKRGFRMETYQKGNRFSTPCIRELLAGAACAADGTEKNDERRAQQMLLHVLGPLK